MAVACDDTGQGTDTAASRPDRADAHAAAWSFGGPSIDPRRRRFGLLFVVVGLGLMAGGGCLAAFVG
jgi:hypothetical protein